jgi:type I restriction enzyme S subunit
MKEGWEYKKLGEVCQSDLGKTLNRSKDKGELYPYLCAINILWDKIDLSTLKQTRFEKDELERYSVKKGDLLICEGGDIGRAAIWDKEESILYQNALHRVRLEENVNARFCLLFLQNLKQKGILDNRYGKGVTIKHLVKSALLSIPIPVPPLSEQQHIVEELDLLSSIIEKKKAQLNELDHLAQSLFYEMFGDPITNDKGWDTSTFNKEFEVSSGGTPSTSKIEYWDNGTISWIGSNMCQNKVLSDNDGKYITQEGLEHSSAKWYHKGFVLVALVGATIGKCALLNFDTTTNQNIAGINVPSNKDFEPYFVFFALQSLYSLFLNIGEGKFKMANLSFVRSLPIIKPPLDLQQRFASKIAAIEHQKELIKQSIKEVEALFNSRMDYYFS